MMGSGNSKMLLNDFVTRDLSAGPSEVRDWLRDWGRPCQAVAATHWSKLVLKFGGEGMANLFCGCEKCRVGIEASRLPRQGDCKTESGKAVWFLCCSGFALN